MRVQLFAATIVAAAAGSALADQYHDLSTFQGATTTQLINFDTDPLGVPLGPGGDVELGSTYAAWGAVFSRGNRSVNFFGGPVSPPRGWLNDTDTGTDHMFDVDITRADITAVGVHNVFFGGVPAGATLTAYGDGGAVLGSVDSDAAPETLDFFGLTTTAPIKRVVILSHEGPGAGWGLDNLYIGQGIPAPSAAATIGLGLLAAGRRRRA